MDAEQAHRGSLSARAPPSRRPDYHHGVHAERPIGMFDSGVGASRCLHECLVTMPHEDFLYAGDTAHFPYGGRSAAELRAFSQEIAGWLVREGVKLDRGRLQLRDGDRAGDLQQSLDVPVIGVAHARRRGPRCSSPATGASACSRPRRRSPAAAIASSCAGSTPASSSSRWRARDWPTRSSAARPTTRRWSSACACTARRCARPSVDTVILGCTHYPLIRGMLQRELGRDVALVAAAEELAEEVAATLARKRLARDHGRRGSYRFACTGDAEAFARVGRRFLQLPISSVRTLGAAELAGLALTSSATGPAARTARAARRTRLLRCDTTAARRTNCALSILLPGFVETADGSVLFSIGRTRVICTASVDAETPRWLRGSGRGWVSAEYGMLPASTGERKQRDSSRGRPDGRSIEIQRLIGRSLRAIVDLQALGERTVWVDCDVLQADGGTRCASICGGYVALHRALGGARRQRACCPSCR